MDIGGDCDPRTTRQALQGWSQSALRISRDFKFPGEEAIVSKEGDRLIIEPAPAKSLLAVLKGLPTLDEDFPLIGDLAPDPADL